MPDSTEILLVEDTVTMQVLYVSILRKAGHSADCAGTISEARELLAGRSYPVILLDLSLPDGDGLELLEEVLAANPETKVIVVTANGSLNKAIEAMRSGAFDFLVKPFSGDKLIASVDMAKEALNGVADRLTPPGSDWSLQQNLIGTSEPIRILRDRITNLSRTDAALFVHGEEGLDKDYFAALLHRESPYGRGPLFELDCPAVINLDHDTDMFCAALPQLEEVTEPTPQMIFDLLQGGTLILKEVCSLCSARQLELLRFLQWLEDGPMMALSDRQLGVRIISTSTRDPMAEVRAGRFRQDLLLRLYKVPLTVPPLRQRPEDIVPCAESFLRLMAMRRDRPLAALSDAAKELMCAYPWPRNIKQLHAVLETVVAFHSVDVIEPHMLGDEILQFARLGQDGPGGEAYGVIATDLAVDNLVGLSLSEVEQRFIEATIQRCRGSVPKAAEILNVAPSTLYRKRESWQNSSIE